jgi:Rps23 Pro-64 3,4-dihydroxylase Tpa1-like proline 4-hydroxylase
MTNDIVFSEKNGLHKIHILDGFLNNDDLKYVTDYIERQSFKFGHSSGPSETVNNKFFATYDFDDFFQIYIKQKLETMYGKTFVINRNYGHIQTFGQDGAYHTDAEESNAYTFCLYLTELDDETIESSGGEFFIKIPNIEPILGIAVTNNRGVFFPSTYVHKGMAYLRPYDAKRVCITWKLQIVDAE